MTRETILEEVRRSKIVAIFRGIDAKHCSPAANAIYDGGINFCEVTFRATEEETDFSSTCDGIRNIIAGADGRNIFVGAGTVLTERQVVLARDAGAQFIITPNVNTKVIRLAKDLGMVAMPGAFTPTEIELAYEAGADIVKIFPASALGTSYFKAVSGPLAHIPLMAVGGIDLNNGKSFLEAGAVGLGIGGNLVSRKVTEAGDFEVLRKLAEEYTASIR
ncbi:MAG: bifunctional 4-hydroxy-2-oxoglutarate aldolase/2-dehydro-3-deoxy-phosphogluconate aldolase [Lachnospiraceae bacterium]|nr:bifunctional 4-hydroxy-2-oxoglutarate aldolase/2-dehydro-3-deoxy-phosphogluconate aldolase [Lachnospiraceae bacterium]